MNFYFSGERQMCHYLLQQCTWLGLNIVLRNKIAHEMEGFQKDYPSNISFRFYKGYFKHFLLVKSTLPNNWMRHCNVWVVFCFCNLYLRVKNDEGFDDLILLWETGDRNIFQMYLCLNSVGRQDDWWLLLATEGQPGSKLNKKLSKNIITASAREGRNVRCRGSLSTALMSNFE